MQRGALGIGSLRISDFSDEELATGLIDWKSLKRRVGQTLVQMDVRLKAQRASRLQIDMIDAAGLGVTWHDSSAISMERDHRHITDDDLATTLTLPISGRFTAEQDGHRVQIKAGQAVLLRGGRASIIQMAGSCDFVGLKLPRACLAPEDARRIQRLFERQGPTPLDCASPAFKLLQAYVFSLRTVRQGFGPAEAGLVRRQIVELVSLCLAGAHPPGESEAQDASLDTVRRAALELMNRHYQDATLSSGDVAGWLGSPPRAIEDAFAEAGGSFEAELTLIRIGHLARALQNPALAAQPVDHVALSHGIDHLADMLVAFEQFYGTDPESYRHLRRS